MADVAFLLLVFFMVATTLQRDKAISMKLPAAYDGPAKKVNEDEVLTLIIPDEVKAAMPHCEILV